MEEEMLENSKVPPQLQPHVFKKGQIANPLGRKKGSISLKQYAKQMLESMTPEEREEYMQGLPKQFIWEMAEGKADTKNETNLTGPLTVQIVNYNANDTDTPQLPETN